MLTKLIAGFVLSGAIAVSGHSAYTASRSCCQSGAECCFPGSPCCAEEASPRPDTSCCFPGSPCCDGPCCASEQR